MEAIRLPGMNSSFTVEPGHSPIVTNLETGIIRIHREQYKKTNIGIIQSGVAYVCNNEVSIITESFVLEKELDIKLDREKLQNLLSKKKLVESDDLHINLLRLQIRAYEISHNISTI